MNRKFHFGCSFIKSIMRISACYLALSSGDWTIMAIGLGGAEILGIIEELGDRRI